VSTIGTYEITRLHACPVTGLEIELRRPGRRHRRAAVEIVEIAWGDREQPDLLSLGPESDPEVIEYGVLWQEAITAQCVRLPGEDAPIGLDRLRDLPVEIAEAWELAFLQFTGFLLELDPDLDEKKNERSGAGWSKSAWNRAKRWLRSFLPSRWRPSISRTSGSARTPPP